MVNFAAENRLSLIDLLKHHFGAAGANLKSASSRQLDDLGYLFLDETRNKFEADQNLDSQSISNLFQSLSHVICSQWDDLGYLFLDETRNIKDDSKLHLQKGY
ncbi:hypothetical protein HAX54_050344 [Datura stramonium]|uniref:DUF4371 domain-containing protein n=1 Tax=Datura stramonium TaxID=4076 RepID=A0ABS8WP46_DATST|nr:hypothetical protein [Datura stramonium]